MIRFAFIGMILLSTSLAAAQVPLPDPNLWFDVNGLPGGVQNPSGEFAVPAVIYDPADGILWLDTSGIDRDPTQTSGILIVERNSHISPAELSCLLSSLVVAQVPLPDHGVFLGALRMADAWSVEVHGTLDQQTINEFLDQTAARPSTLSIVLRTMHVFMDATILSML